MNWFAPPTIPAMALRQVLGLGTSQERIASPKLCVPVLYGSTAITSSTRRCRLAATRNPVGAAKWDMKCWSCIRKRRPSWLGYDPGANIPAARRRRARKVAGGERAKRATPGTRTPIEPHPKRGARLRMQASEESNMPKRRDFLKNVAGATAGMLISGGLVNFLSFQVGAPPGKRRELFIDGRRVKTVDIHSHCFVPEVWDLVKDTDLADTAPAHGTG